MTGIGMGFGDVKYRLSVFECNQRRHYRKGGFTMLSRQLNDNAIATVSTITRNLIATPFIKTRFFFSSHTLNFTTVLSKTLTRTAQSGIMPLAT